MAQGRELYMRAETEQKTKDVRYAPHHHVDIQGMYHV